MSEVPLYASIQVFVLQRSPQVGSILAMCAAVLAYILFAGKQPVRASLVAALAVIFFSLMVRAFSVYLGSPIWSFSAPKLTDLYREPALST